ncbi:MAG: hypothetical protein HKN74_03715 [Acidimicrobiia bacterium]|nr:hypothetical protein [Acidimicrobiia bacterium]NNF09372.1 hypothetical protein [Acidimicrobiia bacterium]NNL71189.1 hypothetical protein [Acidimicrobiia bacterium]
MTDLLDRRDRRTKPPRDRDLNPDRPDLKRPPAPRIYRWIQWMALLAMVAVGAIVAALVIGDGDETIAYESEHGEFTVLAVRDLSGVDLEARFAGLDPIFDPNPVPEHGAFTLMAPGWSVLPDVDRFAGLDANLDRDVVLGAGYHTVMPATWGVIDVDRFAGTDAGLD